ncbi:MAG: DUF3187 family protein [Gemmatimonadales bacterium]
MPTSASAQSDLGLPVQQQSNILASNRSPLYFQPWVPPHAGTRVSVAFDYANIYELAFGFTGGEYAQDLELATVHLGATRDLSPTTFLSADLPVATTWKGGLDDFLHWWHGVLGIVVPERRLRPEHRFAYRVVLPDGDSVEYRPKTYLGDLRFGGGWRFAPGGQLVGTLTLPTATAEGYGRGVISVGAMVTGWTDLDPRLRVEASVGVGHTPRTTGALRPYQRTTFGSVGGGFRWRFYRGTSMYGTLWLHGPYYAHTAMPSLDENEVTFDFGWIFRTKRGAEWRVGMAEDPNPSGPGVDAVFKASRSW